MCDRFDESDSGTAELTGPVCSPAPAPWVPRRTAWSPGPGSPLARLGGSVHGRLGHPAAPAPRRPRAPALPYPGGARRTWLSPGTREFRKGFEYGPCGRGKSGDSLPPASSLWPHRPLKTRGLGEGRGSLRCATHLLNTRKGPSRTPLLPSRTPQPFPVRQGGPARDWS